MKNLRTTLLCACMILCSLCSFSQNEVRVNEPDLNKPKLFAALPESINVNPESFTELFSNMVGTEVNFMIGGVMQFRGRIISSTISAVDDLNTIVIRSTNYAGAKLTFTKAVIDGTVHYMARIISMKHGDLFELKLRNEQYAFVKKNYYDLINE